MTTAATANSFRDLKAFLDAPALPASSPREHARAWAALAERAAGELLDRTGELLEPIGQAHGFNRAESRRAVEAALRPIRADALMAIWEEEIGKRGAGGALNDFTVVFGGGVIPQPNVRAVVAAGMVSRKALYRPPQGDPILAPLLVETMARLQDGESALSGGSPHALPLIRELILCRSWPRDAADLTAETLARADAFVIFGDEPAIRETESMLRPDCRRFVHGPRLSFAAIDLTRKAGKMPAPHRERLADAVAEDAFAYDQRGCLSPAALYLVGGDAPEQEAWLRALAAAMERRAKGSGVARRIPPSAALRIQSLRAIYAMDPDGQRDARQSPGLPGWTLLLDRADARLRPTPGYATLFVIPVADERELLDAARPMAGRLQAMGWGPMERIEQIEQSPKHDDPSTVHIEQSSEPDNPSTDHIEQPSDHVEQSTDQIEQSSERDDESIDCDAQSPDHGISSQPASAGSPLPPASAGGRGPNRESPGGTGEETSASNRKMSGEAEEEISSQPASAGSPLPPASAGGSRSLKNPKRASARLLEPASAHNPNRLPPREALFREIEAMGASRICPIGQMQNPPLDWRHDGHPFFPWTATGKNPSESVP